LKEGVGEKRKQPRRRRKKQLERRRGAEENSLGGGAGGGLERKHSWKEEGVRTQNSLIEGGGRRKTV